MSATGMKYQKQRRGNTKLKAATTATAATTRTTTRARATSHQQHGQFFNVFQHAA